MIQKRRFPFYKQLSQYIVSTLCHAVNILFSRKNSFVYGTKNFKVAERKQMKLVRTELEYQGFGAPSIRVNTESQASKADSNSFYRVIWIYKSVFK